MITEQDRLRAAALVASFTTPDATVVQQAIEDALQKGQQGLLFALHEALATTSMWQGWARQSAWRAAGLIPEATALRNFLERAKLTPTSELPWGVQPRLTDGPARNLGAMLAHAHDDAFLERELEHFGLEPSLRDLFACWIHERIAQGSLIGHSAFVQHFTRALPPDHPLAPLPLDLSPLERGLVLKSGRKTDTLGNWFQFGEHEWGGFEAEGDWQGQAESLPVDPEELAAVAFNQALCPNSTFETRCFRLAARPPSLRAMSLQPLELECLVGAPVKVKSVTARHVMQALIMLGTTGGAYSEARSAAHGRALAWRSMTALTGLPRGAPLSEVEALAARTEWLAFECESEWFNQVSHDVGLVALRPDSTLAVLAVTDTD